MWLTAAVSVCNAEAVVPVPLANAFSPELGNLFVPGGLCRPEPVVVKVATDSDREPSDLRDSDAELDPSHEATPTDSPLHADDGVTFAVTPRMMSARSEVGLQCWDRLVDLVTLPVLRL